MSNFKGIEDFVDSFEKLSKKLNDSLGIIDPEFRLKLFQLWLDNEKDNRVIEIQEKITNDPDGEKEDWRGY